MAIEPGDTGHIAEHNLIRNDRNAAPRTYIRFGPNEPNSPVGAEVVWFQTDGDGNVLDILSGVIE